MRKWILVLAGGAALISLAVSQQGGGQPPLPGMAIIPAGSFEMGDHQGLGDTDHGNDEIPVHKVRLDSFQMAITHVTTRQYGEFLNAALARKSIRVENGLVYRAGGNDLYCETRAASPYSGIGWDGNQFSVLDNRGLHPMVCVRWEGAAAYCNWLSARSGFEPLYDPATWACDFRKKGFRLPTEAEWEYAARGGQHNPYRVFPWGDEPDFTQANWPGSRDPFETGPQPWTTPVGFYDGRLHQKKEFNWLGAQQSYQTRSNANGYGLYDMAGNAWQWIHDWYGHNYYSVSAAENPVGPSRGSPMPDGKPYRGVRGGSWYNGEYGHSRVSNRNPSYFRGPQDPNHPYYAIGFRPVFSAGITPGVDRPDARADEGPGRKPGGPGQKKGGQKKGDRPPRPDPRQDNSPSAFLDNRDGTATEKATGLQWQQTDGGEMTWEKAQQYCAALSLASHHDWRLPSTRELFGIMDQSRPKPAMDTRAFPPTEAEYWWTSEARADDPSRVWVVNAGGGAGPHPQRETLSAGGSKRYHARCVRGSSPAAAGLVDNGDGTVTDRRTGLVWQKAETAGAMTWEEAQQYAKGLSLGGRSDWRLPGIKELQSLNDVKTVQPSIDRKFFPGAKGEQYWSSTAMSNRPAWAWTVDFAVGIVSYSEMAEKLRVRAVRGGPQSEVFYTDVPAHPFDVILTRPTSHSVTASVLAYDDMDGYLEYGAKQGTYSNKTATFQFKKGEPRQIVLASLQPDTRYVYRLRHRPAGASDFAAGADWTFHTQRRRGVSFTFSVQADSHLDENASPDVYQITLANALAGQPDFYVDLGDTFMTDKRRTDFRQAFPQYLAQRYYFGMVCHSAPLFLVLGNHDGESGMRHDGTRNSMAAWSNELRKRYFPNPRPDGFYTGNRASDPVLGTLENYYAWEWGDALFVVLDPYWPTSARSRDDNWHWTLGAGQYGWLAKTLEESKAPLKFVFVHHPVGGKGQPIRGGVEAAMYNEWGGRNEDGSDGFQAHRPGWAMPIHQLLVKNKVAVVFHGHDHMFAKEELDGVVYQLVPQPGSVRTGNPRNAQEYGYVHGGVLGGAGYVRVKVAGSEATVDYILSLSGKDETGTRRNGAVAFSYPVRGR